MLGLPGTVTRGVEMAGSRQVVVNGVAREFAPGPDRSLLFALREELGLTGAKLGCGEGECGACTVLLDGEPVQACQARVSDAAGHVITTVEGLARDGRLHPVQRAFIEAGAFQCGYCTAGMIMSTVALLARHADPDDAQVRSALAGNMCRCCTYPRILRAVRQAADLARDGAAREWDAPVAASTDLPAGSRRPRRPWDLASAA
jgi:aerobic-type carbon monoxide dehydrogenase small subunit (CoxS/CutS family)